MEWIVTATAESFNKRYESNMTAAPTFKSAYEMTEEEHERRFGKRKYSDYNSFKKNRSLYLRKLGYRR